LLHPFQPFIIGQRIIGPAMAAKFGVQLVMYGENQAEYGNNTEENYIPTMDKKFFSVNDPKEIKLGGKTVGEIMANEGYTINDFTPYIPPSAEYLERRGVEVHYLGYYLSGIHRSVIITRPSTLDLRRILRELKGHTRNIVVSMIK